MSASSPLPTASLCRLPILLFPWLLLASCVGPASPRSASGTKIDSTLLLSAEQTVTQRNIPPELREEFIALYSQGRQNSVLHAIRAGLSALRIERYDLARETFDQAIREVEALQEGSAQAERAKSRFVAEREKWFKGESHERAALYFYRGLLYLRDEDFGNAAACFKRSQIQDITGEDAPDFSGDWLSSEIGLALASYRNGFPADALAARQRAERFPNRPHSVSWPTPETNTLLVVEVGRGPFKYRGGRQGEQLRYSESTTQVARIRVTAPAIQEESGATENLFFQATTRGNRQIDFILDGKASFKEDTGTASVGLAAAALAASQTERSGIAAGVLSLAALGTALASASSDPSADTRNWDNLPHSIYLLNLNLPNPPPALQMEALDAAGNVLNTSTVTNVSKPLEPKRLQLYFIPIPDSL
jgi:tetratricopeptide (TPR) repeat protein